MSVKILRTKPIAPTPPICGAVLYTKIGNNKIAPKENEWVFGVHNGKIVNAKHRTVPGVVNGTVVELHHVSKFSSSGKPQIQTYVFFPTRSSYLKALNKFGFAPKSLPWNKTPGHPIRIFGYWIEFTATEPTNVGGCFAYSTKTSVHNGKLVLWFDQNGKSHAGSPVPTDPSKVTRITYNHWNIRKAINKKTNKVIAGQFEMVEEQVDLKNVKLTHIGPLS